MKTQSDRQKRYIKEAREEQGNIYIDEEFINFINKNL